MNVHIDAELAESIIQLNSLLDSMWGIAKKVLACAAVVAMAAAAVVAYLGPLVSQRPGEFTLLVLLVLAVGLLAGYGTAMIRWRGKIDSQISLRDDKISELEESAIPTTSCSTKYATTTSCTSPPACSCKTASFPKAPAGC